MGLARKVWRRLFKHAPVAAAASPFPAFVRHGPQCSVDPSVQFRDHAGEPITLGEHVTILRGGELCGRITLGDHAWLNRDVYLRPHTTLGRYVSVGPFVQFVTDGHELATEGPRRAGKTYYAPITVGDGAWIGAGAIILGGVTIGRGAVVGAGAVVVKDVEPDTLYAGVPARKIRDLPPLVDRRAEESDRPFTPHPLRPAA